MIRFASAGLFLLLFSHLPDTNMFACDPGAVAQEKRTGVVRPGGVRLRVPGEMPFDDPCTPGADAEMRGPPARGQGWGRGIHTCGIARAPTSSRNGYDIAVLTDEISHVRMVQEQCGPIHFVVSHTHPLCPLPRPNKYRVVDGSRTSSISD